MKSSILLLALLFVLVQAGKIPMQDKKEVETQQIASKDVAYFHEKRKRGTFRIYFKSKSDECTFKKYAPCGEIDKIGEIEAPVAKMAKKGLGAILGGAMGKLGKGASIAMHAMKFSASLMKAVPMLGPALGVFSAVSGMLNPAPSAQDILDQANTAIAQLTDEVNKKIKGMEGYVDSKVAKLEKELVDNNYQSSFRLWAQCIENPTEEEANECQRDAVKHAVAIRPKFTPEAGKLTGDVDFDTVRKLEAYMLAFRDYANLVVMEITPLLEYYCTHNKEIENAGHYCDQYATKMEVEVAFFIKYAKEAIAAIKKGHWGKDKGGACIDTVKCTSRKYWEGAFGNWHSINIDSCECEIESSNTKKYCKVNFDTRVDGSKSSAYSVFNYGNIPSDQFVKGAEEYGKRKLMEYAHGYQEQNHKVMDAYWQSNVFDFIPDWEQAIEMAGEMRTKNPKGDQLPVLDTFSPRYQARLDAAGYKFVDMTDMTEDAEAEEIMLESNLDESEKSN